MSIFPPREWLDATRSTAASSIKKKKKLIMGALCHRLEARTRGKWREANVGVEWRAHGAKYLKEEPFPPSLRRKGRAEELKRRCCRLVIY